MNTLAAPGVGRRDSPRERPQVRALTVLYDSACPVCRASKRWLLVHRALVELRLVDVRSELARQRFPQLDLARCLREITVVTDTGHVYRGDAAVVMCLWALRRTRGLSLQMARGRRGRFLGAITGSTGWFREMMLQGGCDDACQTRLQ